MPSDQPSKVALVSMKYAGREVSFSTQSWKWKINLLQGCVQKKELFRDQLRADVGI